MTVEIKSQKSKADLPASEAAARAPRLRDIVDIDPLQQGQALLAANKKRKKQQKRAGLYTYSSSGILFIYSLSIILCLFVSLTFINKIKHIHHLYHTLLKNGWAHCS